MKGLVKAPEHQRMLPTGVYKNPDGIFNTQILKNLRYREKPLVENLKEESKK